MRFTVLTACYNAAATLERTIASVAAQDYEDVEFVIVDGCSKDETWSIVQRHRDVIDLAIQEPDDGVYDALNKGIRVSSGDVILVLGGDDYLIAADVLSRIARAFAFHPEVDVVYGDYMRENGAKRVPRQHPDYLTKSSFFRRNVLCHQAMVCRRRAFDTVGLFDTSLRICSDHDWNIRAFGIEQVPYFHLPEMVSVYSDGGLSASTAYKREHALVRQRHFGAHVRAYWVAADLAQRLSHRLLTLNFDLPLALRDRLTGPSHASKARPSE